MKEDIERLYASNVRIALDAYDFLLTNKVSSAALHNMIESETPILSLEQVQSAIREAQKIPMPEHLHKKTEEDIEKKAQDMVRLEGERKAANDAQKDNTAPAINLQMEPDMQELSRKAVGNTESHDGIKSDGTKTFSKKADAQEKKITNAKIERNEWDAQGKGAPANNIGEAKEGQAVAGGFANITGATGSEQNKPVPVEVIRAPSFKPSAKDYSPKITIHEHRDVSGQSRCVGTVGDFVAYFKNRFEQESAILRDHPTKYPYLRTDQLSAHAGETVRIIVMISDKRITDKENLWLEVEDAHGQARVLISPREQCYKNAKMVLKDDVVALDGKIGPNFFIANNIVWPDIPLIRQQPKPEADIAIAYLSDIHFGSRFYIEKAFKRFTRWLWGEEGREDLAGKVKYIVIAGDVVDGIGVYPSQEKELTITDIYKQYEEFDKFVESLPDHIEVIVSPGNHDAVRRGEPQPIIPMDLIKTDVKKIGSPSSLDIEELKHLVYHGTSIDSVIANISGLSYAKPEGPMLEMLKRRHLSPIYGENLIVPELRDYMVISEEPDVVHMGHLHKNAAMKYRGTLLINSGTFQERTDFQVKMGHIPSPGIVPVLEIKSGQLNHLKFLEESI